MKNRWHDFPRKMQHPLLLAAGTLPLSLSILAEGFPQKLLIMALLFVGIYLLLAWASLLVSGDWRFVIGGVGVALFIGFTFWLLPIREKLFLLFLPAGYSILLLLTLPIGGWHREEELSPLWFVIYAVLHLLTFLVQQFKQRHMLIEDFPYDMQAFSTLLMVSFLLFLLLAMLALNRISLTRASQYRVQVPQHMRRRNIVLTVGLFLLTLLISALPAIGAFLRRLWDGFIALIIRIANWFSSLLATGESGGGGGGSADMTGGMGMMETPEPTLFQIIVEKILFALAFVVGVALLIWMGWELWKKLKKLLKWLWQRMEMFSNAVTKDYEDEVTDTRDGAQYERTNPLQRLRQRLARVDESQLSPAQRVRYRYLRLRMKHREWLPASTVRDTLPTEAAHLYERARYGNQPLTEQEAQRFREETRRV